VRGYVTTYVSAPSWRFLQWRQATASLRDEQRHLGLEVARLGRENEQLQQEVARRHHDTEALQAETALKEREMRRADKYCNQADERLEQLHRTEQRLATAEAALAHCRKEAADSRTEASAAAEQLALVSAAAVPRPGSSPSSWCVTNVRQANSVSRGDEAIAAAEVLVLRGELDALRRKEAETAKALGERSEVRACPCARVCCVPPGQSVPQLSDCTIPFAVRRRNMDGNPAGM
jgi:predicted RNase H-like nuclease (RuvC/YqgF family)